MNRNNVMKWIGWAFILGATALRAQFIPPSAVGSLVRSSTPPAISEKSYSAPSMVMIKNRARTLGNQATGSRTRYFAVGDSDLIGKNPEEVLKLLEPTPVNASDGVRRLDLLIDVTRAPLTILGRPGQELNVGMAVVDSLGLKNIEVHSNIFTSGLTVVSR